VLLLSIAGHGFVGELLAIANPLEWLLGVSLPGWPSARGAGVSAGCFGGLVLASVVGRLLQGLLDHSAPALVSTPTGPRGNFP
jgi:hypothetical protein